MTQPDVWLINRKEDKYMKTLINLTIILLLIANTTIAQAVNYPTYNSTTRKVFYEPESMTRVYQEGSGVLQTNDFTPLVDEDGYAVEPYSTPAAGGPRHAKGDHGGTPGANVDKGQLGTPIGSIMILLLFALMHVAFIAYSTRKNKA